MDLKKHPNYLKYTTGLSKISLTSGLSSEKLNAKIRSGPLGFNFWISFALVFSCMYCRVVNFLCFISFLYLDLYVLDDAIFHANQASMCLDPHQN